MFFIIPKQVETLPIYSPWANMALIGVISVVTLLFWGDALSPTTLNAMVLDGWKPMGLVGHVFLHADMMHLLGNMIFLWVFGNAINAKLGQIGYLGFFLFCTLAAAMAHNLFDGGLAIGASGAVNGIVGFYIALHPLNRIHCFYWVFVKAGIFTVTGFWLVLFWFILDLWGAFWGTSLIAYWAHIGGLVGGFAVGWILLASGKLRMTVYDNPSVVEIATGQTLEREGF